MSWVDFSKCKTLEEISTKLLERFNGSEGHVAMATAFAQHILQKELLVEQNSFQEKQLQNLEKQNRHAYGLLKATQYLVIISLVANLFIVVAGIRQTILLNNYTMETQRLRTVAQEQLDLQLQPALIVTADGISNSNIKYLRLTNIGHGVGLNIRITSNNDNIQFTEIPNIMYSNSDKALCFINKSSKNSSDHGNNAYSFVDDNSKLIINLEYDNINNKTYFTKIEVAKERVKLLERGEKKKT